MSRKKRDRQRREKKLTKRWQSVIDNLHRSADTSLAFGNNSLESYYSNGHLAVVSHLIKHFPQLLQPNA